MKNIFLAILAMATLTLKSQKKSDKQLEKWQSGRPDGHAPILVMGDHIHNKGDWMFSYRYMYMNMEDLKQGANDAKLTEALANYMVTPINMPMNMHMLGAMYAPSDNLTLMAMTNITSMKMDHVTRMEGAFTTKVAGLGDISLSALYRFFNKNSKTMHGQLGVSLPTGSITESDVTPASAPNETILPYPMQLGTGTFDTHLAITYLAQNEFLSFGSQLKSTLRFGENNRDFRYGNRYSFTNWIALKTTDWLSFSIKAEGLLLNEISGQDQNLIPMMVITADTTNSGGSFINTGLGFNIYVPNGSLKNLRFGLELGLPLYQDLNGIQLKTKETITTGIQYSF